MCLLRACVCVPCRGCVCVEYIAHSGGDCCIGSKSNVNCVWLLVGVCVVGLRHTLCMLHGVCVCVCVDLVCALCKCVPHMLGERFVCGICMVCVVYVHSVCVVIAW